MNLTNKAGVTCELLGAWLKGNLPPGDVSIFFIGQCKVWNKPALKLWNHNFDQDISYEKWIISGSEKRSYKRAFLVSYQICVSDYKRRGTWSSVIYNKIVNPRFCPSVRPSVRPPSDPAQNIRGHQFRSTWRCSWVRRAPLPHYRVFCWDASISSTSVW